MKLPTQAIEPGSEKYARYRSLFQPLGEKPKTVWVQSKPGAFEAIADQLPHSGLAIVGTRNPQIRTRRFLEFFVEDLRDTGLIIISGFARGIDTVAHKSALSAGLRTVAILGAGIDVNYPAQNESLRKEIVYNDGALISEFPPEATPRAGQFLKRNRLIAAWAKATLVAEAPFRSGALNTARWARDLDRTCFAIPCFPGDQALSGNQKLIERHHALPLWGTYDLATVWLDRFDRLRSKPTKTVKKIANPELERLLDRVAQATHQSGGIHVLSLLDWSRELQWDGKRFFNALHLALQTKRVSDHAGTLVLNKRESFYTESPPFL